MPVYTNRKFKGELGWDEEAIRTAIVCLPSDSKGLDTKTFKAAVANFQGRWDLDPDRLVGPHRERPQPTRITGPP